MTLQDLLDRLPVTSIAYDSRSVKPGAIFVALRGVNADGARFAPQAIANGAIAVVAETAAPASVTVPWVQVPNARAALAALAAAFYAQPERRARAGRHHRDKRQDHHVVRAGVDLRGGRHDSAGASAPSATQVGGRELDAPRTTPEAPELQQMLRDMLAQRAAARA